MALATRGPVPCRRWLLALSFLVSFMSVCAENSTTSAAPESTAAPTTTPMPTTTPAVPNPPGNVSVISTTVDSITVQWTLPAGQNGGFNVHCAGLNGAVNGDGVAATGATEGTCGSLTSGAQYDVTVSTKAAGDPDISAAADAVPAVTVPNPPVDVSVKSTTVDSITVQWNLPAGQNGGFIVHCAGLNLAVNGEGVATTNITEGTCGSLTSGAQYNVTVSTKAAGDPDTYPPPTAAVPVPAVTGESSTCARPVRGVMGSVWAGRTRDENTV